MQVSEGVFVALGGLISGGLAPHKRMTIRYVALSTSSGSGLLHPPACSGQATTLDGVLPQAQL
jgi:hypothetical protein